MRCCLAVEMLVNQAFDRILTDGPDQVAGVHPPTQSRESIYRTLGRRGSSGYAPTTERGAEPTACSSARWLGYLKETERGAGSGMAKIIGERSR